MHSRYYGYLIIITKTTHDITTAIARPDTDITLLDCLIKNNFEWYQMCVLFLKFLYIDDIISILSSYWKIFISLVAIVSEYANGIIILS